MGIEGTSESRGLGFPRQVGTCMVFDLQVLFQTMIRARTNQRHELKRMVNRNLLELKLLMISNTALLVLVNALLAMEQTINQMRPKSAKQGVYQSAR